MEGLGLLKGQIRRIPDKEGLKIPHIGWNSLDFHNKADYLPEWKNTRMYISFILIICMPRSLKL